METLCSIRRTLSSNFFFRTCSIIMNIERGLPGSIFACVSVLYWCWLIVIERCKKTHNTSSTFIRKQYHDCTATFVQGQEVGGYIRLTIKKINKERLKVSRLVARPNSFSIAGGTGCNRISELLTLELGGKGCGNHILSIICETPQFGDIGVRTSQSFLHVRLDFLVLVEVMRYDRPAARDSDCHCFHSTSML